jgi:two-component system CheB/CheR fusion protein
MPGKRKPSRSVRERAQATETNGHATPGAPNADTSSVGADARNERPRMPIVGIGCSAGGLEAMQSFFSNVPPDTGAAFVVVTHVRPGRDSMLPDLLAQVTRMRVVHAGDSTLLEPNTVVVARDSLLAVSKGVLVPAREDGAPLVTYHPIDHFFRSLADDQKEHAIGVILSGSGNDGSLGTRAIKAAGGMIMVQAPDSAKYTGMPDSAIATHLADYVLPPADMPSALVEYCRGAYLQTLRRDKVELLPEATVHRILMRLHAHSGQDFTCYKRSTISRRIQRRMTVHRIEDPQAYLGFLRDNPHEMDALMEELLISVTSFFRDPRRGMRWPVSSRHSWSTTAAKATRSGSGFPGVRPARRHTRAPWSCTRSFARSSADIHCKFLPPISTSAPSRWPVWDSTPRVLRRTCRRCG